MTGQRSNLLSYAPAIPTEPAGPAASQQYAKPEPQDRPPSTWLAGQSIL